MQDPNIELMYRAPGQQEHESLVKILDKLHYSIEKLENRLTQLEIKNETVC